MQSPLHAIIWETLRVSRFEILMRFGSLTGIVVMIAVAAIRFREFVGHELTIIAGIVTTLLLLGSAGSVLWVGQLDNQSSGFRLRHSFTLPVSTSVLVLVPIAITIGYGVACYVVPGVVFGLLTGTWIPLLYPIPLIATANVCLIAATWAPRSRLGKAATFIPICCGLLFMLRWNYDRLELSEPWLYEVAGSQVLRFSPAVYFILATISVIAAGCTIQFVDRQRHGDTGPLSGFLAAVQSYCIRAANRGQSRAKQSHGAFRSRATAQCWYEFQRAGWATLVFALVLPCILFGVSLLIDSQGAAPTASPRIWLVALVLAPFLYQLIAAELAAGLRRQDGEVSLSPFDATRPLSNDALILCKLAVIALCSILGWLIVGIAFAAFVWRTNANPEWQTMWETARDLVGDVPGHWWAVAALGLVVQYVASTSTLLAFHLWLPVYRKKFMGFLVFSYVSVIVAVIDASSSSWTLAPLWSMYGYGLGLAWVVGGLWALRYAIRSGFVTQRTLLVSTMVWTLYVACVVWLYTTRAGQFEVPTPLLAFAVASLFIPLVATVVAPLAFATHRHG